MELNENIQEFENKSIERRIEFIETYDFSSDQDNKKYFIERIKDFHLTSNNWYNVLVIELAEEFSIKDIPLFNKYRGYLSSSNYYLIKLSVLDYLAETYDYYLKENIDFKFLSNLKTNDRLIVKNQIILLQVLVDQENYRKYIMTLIKSIRKTKDYRSHVRVYNFIETYLTDVLPKSTLVELSKYSIEKNLGNAVHESISRLLNKY